MKTSCSRDQLIFGDERVIQLLPLVAILFTAAAEASERPDKVGTMGTGMSTEAYIQDGFKFAISYPKDFAPSTTTTQCSFDAKCTHVDFARNSSGKIIPSAAQGTDGATDARFNIEFAAEVKTGSSKSEPLVDMAQLEAELKAHFPDFEWRPITDTSYASGFVYRKQSPLQTQIAVAYLVGPEQVTLIQTNYREGTPEAWAFGNMLESVRKLNQPPKVLEAAAEQKVIRVGQQSCWRFLVDDVRGFLVRSSLSEFELMGESPKSPWKTVEITQSSKNLTTVKFRVCFEVSKAMGQQNLLPSKVTFTNVREASNTCTLRSPDGSAPLLSCSGFNEQLHLKVPRVANNVPDREGPKILRARMDPATGVLELESSDASKIETIQVIMEPGGRQIFVAESSYGNSKFRIQVKGQEAGIGRNIIRALAVSDELGWATVLQLNQSKGYYTEFPAGSTDDVGQFRDRPDIMAMSYWRNGTP